MAHQSEIVSGEMTVFFLDECHLLWGDVCGYVWGQTSERIEVPIVNERQRQTYFGALNYYTQEFLVKAYKKGDSESTIAFLQYLLSECPTSRITLIWDGASYHRSAEVRAYLDSLNHGLDEAEWKITCIRFAPNAPEQNPVEDVWLSARAFSSRVLPPVQIILCGEAIIRVCHSPSDFRFPKVVYVWFIFMNHLGLLYLDSLARVK